MSESDTESESESDRNRELRDIIKVVRPFFLFLVSNLIRELWLDIELLTAKLGSLFLIQALKGQCPGKSRVEDLPSV